jgi:hypothetical protein
VGGSGVVIEVDGGVEEDANNDGAEGVRDGENDVVVGGGETRSINQISPRKLYPPDVAC